MKMDRDRAKMELQKQLTIAYAELKKAQDIADEHGLVFCFHPDGSDSIYPNVFYYGSAEKAGIPPGEYPEDGKYDRDGAIWQGYEDREPFDQEWVSSNRFC